MAQRCGELAELAARHGVPILFVAIPAVEQVDLRLTRFYGEAIGLRWPDDIDVEQPRRRLLGRLERAGLRVVDTTLELRRAQADGERPYGQVDPHLSPEGHAIVARAAEAAILEQLAGGR